MKELFPLTIHFILLISILFFSVFLIYSYREKEKQAVKRIIPILSVLFIALILNTLNYIPVIIQQVASILFVGGVIVVLIPLKTKKISYALPKEKYDERDIMFSRMELEEGSTKFENYYQNNPQKRKTDDIFRKEPGLLNEKSKYYNPILFNAAEATFSTVDALQQLVDKETTNKDTLVKNATELNCFLKNWTKKLGACDVGFTRLKPYHIYSHIGRGNDYGKEVKLDHKYAIAFTVEMDHDALQHAPQGPIIMESAQQYLNAGKIAVQIALFLRNLGYDARAHIDANYRLICPLVAMDAGLGNIGRMGLLMTPRLGPRVRIGVVTTNLKLEVNRKVFDSSVIRFCDICYKCADNCPSSAIPKNSHKEEKNRPPWKVNNEKCFTYWCKAGTDCGRCIKVCPYSHPDNMIHNLIRWGIKRNGLNRRIALKLDDYFYGRKPAILPV